MAEGGANGLWTRRAIMEARTAGMAHMAGGN
jgi:hypothetical protein